MYMYIYILTDDSYLIQTKFFRSHLIERKTARYIIV